MQILVVIGDIVKINLGCGKYPKAGYVNCDILDINGVNKIFDINEKTYPFDDFSVSEILCEEVIEHIENNKVFFTECNRILKNGGILEIITPNIYSWMNRIFRNYESNPKDHINLQSISTLKSYAEKYGFEIVEIKMGYYDNRWKHKFNSIRKFVSVFMPNGLQERIFIKIIKVKKS